ncbi:hypothetical protein RHMOL_Rhmol02G0195700 [Rhododendron molle]|uniref:Uncharacterized protein n=1 Tax=Rhododendron molle TaxID=49168 RepID=A0ACC0PTC1_RHOML|nr:hypothetical protein RHMOL_Rhmol02G0195700 [Rhododendron molle]
MGFPKKVDDLANDFFAVEHRAFITEVWPVALDPYQEHIIDEFLPRPTVEIPDEPNICVLDPEELWGKAELVNIWVDGEELTVNKAMLDEGSLQVNNNNNVNFWNSLEEENIWNALEMEFLIDTLEKMKIDKGKRKADIDLSNFWEDSWWDPIPETVTNLTKSGRTTTEEVTGTSAVVASGGDGGSGQQQEVGDAEKDRKTEENPRATVLAGAVGSIVESGGSGTVAEGLSIVGGSSGGGGSSGAVGDVPGPNGSQPRDPVRGKSAVIAEEEEPIEVPVVEYREQDVAFRPAASAAHHHATYRIQSKILPSTYPTIC